MGLNALQKALVKAGLAERPQEKKPHKGKSVICRKCGKPMDKLTDTNIAVCRNCDKGISYIVFDR